VTRTAIIAGSGALPTLLADALDQPVYVTLDDSSVPTGIDHISARIEKLGRLFKDLHARNVTSVAFAGAMARPKVNPVLLDRHALRLAMSMGKGDDALLREVLAVFSDQGFAIKSAVDICPDLVLPQDALWGAKPSKQDMQDIQRALDVLGVLAPHDVGQGAVCAGGMMLGIETLQGTDSMLSYVASTPEHLRRSKGVFVKTPKHGQDLRIDMPTIGPDTIEGVIKAGLAGLAIPAGQVIVLDRAVVKSRIQEAGLFLKAL
jgi:DUF1009 family protein